LLCWTKSAIADTPRPRLRALGWVEKDCLKILRQIFEMTLLSLLIKKKSDLSNIESVISS